MNPGPELDMAIPFDTPRKYRCSKGHTWESKPWEIVACYSLNVPFSGGRSESVTLCPYCVLEFAKTHLGTVEEVK